VSVCVCWSSWIWSSEFQSSPYNQLLFVASIHMKGLAVVSAAPTAGALISDQLKGLNIKDTVFIQQVLTHIQRRTELSALDHLANQ